MKRLAELESDAKHPQDIADENSNNNENGSIHSPTPTESVENASSPPPVEPKGQTDELSSDMDDLQLDDQGRPRQQRPSAGCSERAARLWGDRRDPRG